MEINEAISLVSSIASGIKDVKQACSLIPVGFFQPTRRSLGELQDKITELETKINNGFPKFKQLIILYSELKTDVSIARALSDKIAEIIMLSPTVAPNYVVGLIQPIQVDCIRITNQTNKLPCLDQAEAGAIHEKLIRVDRYIRDIKNLLSRNQPDESERNFKDIAKIFQDIAGEYGGIEIKLSELLTRKILKDFDFIEKF